MSDTAFRTSISVPTLLGVINQFHGIMNLSYTYRPDTTINKKRGVFAGIQPTRIPVCKYFGIGIRGFANISSQDNLAQPYYPSPENQDLYEPIPFRCVPERLSSTEEAKYRIRTTATINGQTYYQYWLKCIEFEDSSVRTTQIDGEGREIPYVIDSNNLNPVPSLANSSDVLNGTTSRIVASVVGICEVTGKEVVEVINAMYGGDLRKARISEFGVYSGEDYAVTAEADPDGIAYTEAVYVQLASHRCTLGTDLSNESTVLRERKVFENGSCVVL